MAKIDNCAIEISEHGILTITRQDGDRASRVELQLDGCGAANMAAAMTVLNDNWEHDRNVISTPAKAPFE